MIVEELKDVRLFHWSEAVWLRKCAESLRERRHHSLAATMDKIAALHVKCVQILNEHVPGTAEEDSRVIPDAPSFFK